jgi:rRNA maturation RNase YbeY
MAISFHFHDIRLPLHNRRKLKAFLSEMLQMEGKQVAQLHYIFCRDEFLETLNRQYLQHKTLTDILTFDLSDDPAQVLAEIYISGDRVGENAIIFKEPFSRELHRVIFHGVLHLCGYGDHEPDEKKLMREKENQWLNRYFDS